MIVYPIEWHRKVLGKSQARSAQQSAVAALTLPDDSANGARCPGCNATGPTAPVRSRYRAARWIEHVWLCSTCGHEWTTSLQVPS